MAKSSFFSEKQAAAVLKHGILGRYVRTFCSKTGATSSGNRVVYLDCYAGQGTYDDGQPGSPMLVASTASSLAQLRDVLGIYIERDKKTAKLLADNLAHTTHSHVVLCGEAEECLEDALLRFGADDPLIAFFDPFGLPVSMDAISEVMSRSKMSGGYRHGPPTEVIVTLSYPGLRRNAGHLTSKSTDGRYAGARETRLASLNKTFGGDWWKEVWERGATDRVLDIASGYRDRLAAKLHARAWYQVPVSRRWGGPTVYELLFFTQYPEQGIWHFNECVSLALEAYREFCARGQLELDAQAREVHWVDTIAGNIRRAIGASGGVHLGEALSQVYGDTLGLARAKHLRAALKKLHEAGAIAHDGTGTLSADTYVQ